jgi:light-regulated signal transduction histidine kinase (bacteriophytochrome)
MGSEMSGGGTPRSITNLWLAQYRRSQAEGRFVRFEYEHPRAAGPCWLNCCVNFLGIGPHGRPRFSYVAEDVTDRKRNEELLQHSNAELRRANADLEQFAYSASHDLQEPLRQIAVYSQLLEKKFAARLDGKGGQYLGYCVEGAQRMEMLISGLLEYSQVSRPSQSPAGRVNIGEVIETVRKNLATVMEETGAEVTAGDLPTVHGDPAPLVHLFQNLVSNALKYRGERRPRVNIGAAPEDGFWRFSVEDNGIGIPREFHSQIFGIFKRLHDRSEYPGTGIGLAICQKIVERAGGRIWVESEPGRGSTFFFTLPRVDHEN